MGLSVSDRTHDPVHRLLLATLLAAPLTFGVASAQSEMPVYEGVDELAPIHLRMTEGSAPTATPQSVAFVDYVREASKGKIEIEVFWSGSLMALNEVPEGLASGLADIGMALPVYTPAEFPITNWVNTLANRLGGGLPHGKLVSQAVAEEFFLRNEPIQKEYSDHGLYILGNTAQDAYDLLCTRPVGNMLQAKGVRTRTGNQASSKEVESIGNVAVPILPAEMYEALQRGIIDCAVCSPTCYLTTGLVDVPGDKYWIDIDLSGWLIQFMLISKDKWNSLPPVAQRILVDAFTRYLQVDAETTYANTKLFGDRIEAGDITAVPVDAELAATLQAHQDKVSAEMLATAPAGVTDPKATVDQFTAILDKWHKIVGEDLGIPLQPTDTPAVVASWNTDYDFGPFQKRLAEEVAAAYQELGR